MPKVTVIMPALNVVKYIEQCIKSVLSQTLSDIEILVIDAGSSDGTLEALQKYCKRDSRIRLVHSDKKSYGYQINMGISLSEGEYVGIVETDDEIVPDMFEALYDVAERTNAEYVKGRCEQFVDIEKGIEWNFPIGTPLAERELLGKVIEPRNMPQLLVNDIYLWTGIYRKDFIKKIKLNETPGAAFQDQGFLFQTISSAVRAVYVDKIVYRYRQNNVKSSIFNKKGFQYLAGEYGYVEEFLKGKDAGWECAYYRRMFAQCMGRFRTMAVSGGFWDDAENDMETLRRKLLAAVEKEKIQPRDIGIQQWKLLQLFLRGSRVIFDYYLGEFQKRIGVIKGLLQMINGQNVIIFGSGRYGKFFHALLENKYPGQAVAFCDNNSELWDSSLQGIPVLSPDKAVEEFPESMYVIANLRNVDAMKKQLEELGISDKKICLYQEAPDMLLFQMKEI